MERMVKFAFRFDGSTLETVTITVDWWSETFSRWGLTPVGDLLRDIA